MLLDLLVLCLPYIAYGAVNPPLPPPSAPPSTPPLNGIHYTIERRGGPFAPNRTANLTYLAEQLAAAESRFNYTSREVRGNKIVRVPKAKPLGDEAQGGLLGEIGRLGTWCVYFIHITLSNLLTPCQVRDSQVRDPTSTNPIRFGHVDRRLRHSYHHFAAREPL